MRSLEDLEKALEDIEKAVKELQEKKRIYNEAYLKFEDAKGELLKEILETESFKKCHELQEKISSLISDFPQYDKEATKLVDYFKPFNNKRKVIPLNTQELYLVIANTIYITPKPKVHRHPSAEEVFQTLIEHADKIIPNVRKDIREELTEFCRLGEKLMAELKGEFVAREGKFRTLSLEYLNHPEGWTTVRLSWRTYDKIVIYIDLTRAFWARRCYLILTNASGKDELMLNTDEVCYAPLRFHGLYDTLAEMYEEVYKKLQVKKECCDKILKEMKKTVAPLILSEL